MKIVFALIVIWSNGHGGAPIKIGEYEKFKQCQDQGKKVADEWSYTSAFKCVPVNATGR